MLYVCKMYVLTLRTMKKFENSFNIHKNRKLFFSGTWFFSGKSHWQKIGECGKNKTFSSMKVSIFLSWLKKKMFLNQHFFFC